MEHRYCSIYKGVAMVNITTKNLPTTRLNVTFLVWEGAKDT
jgi:hypothetical protein